MAKDPADLLPTKKNAPKKTGGRGIGPVEEDAASKLATLEKPTPKKEEPGTLLIKQPETPTVANGRMKVFFAKPEFSKYKDVVLIALKCTVALTEKHHSLLPKIVADGFHDVNKKGRSRINLRDIPTQRVEFYLESDRKTPALTLPAARLVSANVAVIQRKGEGTTRQVIRFAFHVQAKNSDMINTFATKNLNNDFWIEMSNTQTSLWDEDEEED